ncbi:CoA-binding protein [Cytophagaceae bacterium AH-315-L13]|nr:CoA-binding protein [Cytophagaceae bacterium AH-315-L13]
MTTLVLGASPKPERYSYKAVCSLRNSDHPVIAYGNRGGEVCGVDIQTSDFENISDVHTISLYINSTFQKEYYDMILKLKPQRIIFNPGTENEELSKLAEENDIQTLEACTLVLLSIGNY